MQIKFKVSFNAPVVLTFSIMCFVVTILGIITKGALTQALFMTYHSSPSSPFTYVRFLTHILGHANFAHFMGNVSYLLLIGPLLEEKYGSKNVVIVMITTAIVTGLVNYALFPNVGLCGASGVVFAFIIMASFTGFSEGEIPLTFILVSLIYIGQQIYEGLAVNDNISNMAHIVGGIVGAVIGYHLNVRRNKKNSNE